jgi:protein gp37
MSANTSIQWTHHTFNPWWGCTHISPGCEHCYAEAWDKRTGGSHWGLAKERRFFGAKHWREPLKWNEAAKKTGERHRVFCASMADVFEDRRDLDEQRNALWELILSTPCLDWLLLTKRPQNAVNMLPWGRSGLGPTPWKNVWLGTTVEDQKRANERIPILGQIPAGVRFLSCEPLLERLSLSLKGIHWVIVGGESGAGARRLDVEWARTIVHRCKEDGVAVFVKQLGAFVVDRNDAGFEAENEVFAEGQDAGRPVNPSAWPTPSDVEHDIDGYREEYQGAPVRIRLRDSRHGGDPSEWPDDLRVRKFPAVQS